MTKPGRPERKLIEVLRELHEQGGSRFGEALDDPHLGSVLEALHQDPAQPWSLDEMAYVETVFGHQDAVMGIDAMMKERAVSVGGRDNTVRVWKIVEESQFVYSGLG